MTRNRKASRAVLGAVTSAAVLGLLVGCGEDPSTQPSSSGVGQVGEVATFSGLSRNHTEGEVDYSQTPPVGGDHNPVWLDCNGTVYGDPIHDEKAVHSLEHGAVWLTYEPDISPSDVKALRSKVEGQQYIFMSPYPDQSAPVMATAWGVQLQLNDATDPALNDFIEKFRSGEQTPEPGATCDSGVML